MEFRFHRYPVDHPDDPGVIFASASKIPEKGGYNQPQVKYRYHRVDLNPDYYTVAEKLFKSPDALTVAARLRYNLNLANILLHEIAHCVNLFVVQEMFPPGTEGGPGVWIEPSLLGQNFNECGWAFERLMWGGRIYPVGYRMDCAFGLALDRDDVLRSIPMGHIEELQQQDTWTRLLRKQDVSPGVLHLPTRGHRVIGDNIVRREKLGHFFKTGEEDLKSIFARVSPMEDLMPEFPRFEQLEPFRPLLDGKVQHEQEAIILEAMNRARGDPNDFEQIGRMWEIWEVYESPGMMKELREEKFWHLAENLWRLHGGKSSKFWKRRMSGEKFLPDDVNPEVMGAWGEEAMKNYYQKRLEVLGIPPPDDTRQRSLSLGSSDGSPELRPMTRRWLEERAKAGEPKSSRHTRQAPDRLYFESDDLYRQRLELNGFHYSVNENRWKYSDVDGERDVTFNDFPLKYSGPVEN